MGAEKIFLIESANGPYKLLLHNVMRMVPDRDKSDVALQRLVAFRLRIDGESATREFLMQNIRDMIQSAFKGRLYDFLTDQAVSKPFPRYKIPEPPDSA
jgi:hypothetical protein